MLLNNAYTSQPVPIQVTANRLKNEYPGSFAVDIDFTSATEFSFSRSLADLYWSNVKSVYIDNSANPNDLNINFPGGGYTISAPPYSQGFYPVLNTGMSLDFIADTTGAVPVYLRFHNIATEFYNWSVLAPGAITGTVTVTGTVTTNPLATTATNRGLALTTGGTSQQLMAANGSRKGIVINNPGTIASQGIAALEPIYINFGSAASINGTDSIEILPGGYLILTAGDVITSAVNVNAATTGHIIIAKELV